MLSVTRSDNIGSADMPVLVMLEQQGISKIAVCPHSSHTLLHFNILAFLRCLAVIVSHMAAPRLFH